MRQRYFLLFIFLIFIAGVVIGYFCYKNYESKVKSDSTRNWNTYTNSMYGYSFQYPSPWIEVPYTPDIETEGDVLLIDKPGYASQFIKYSYLINDFSKITFTVITFGKEYTIAGQKKIYKSDVDLKEYIKDFTWAKEADILDYTLGGKRGLIRIDKRNYEGEPSIYTKQVFIKINEGILSIDYTYGEDDVRKNLVETDFDQILSTFKFIR